MLCNSRGEQPGATGIQVPANTDMRLAVENYIEDSSSYPSGSIINCWDASKVISMAAAFASKPFNECLDCWGITSVEIMINMFRDTAVFNQRLDTWDVSYVTDMLWMFHRETDYNQPLNP